ncbi:MAG: oligosaccharide flippase family protein [Saprospiraceae bacterium]|nr:oligosaccharide flippase family protein [Saprospiraceae bacterium]
MSLKEKTIKGLSWSFIDQFLRLFLQFFIGIILARLLTPEEYGIIGLLAIFFAFSNAFTYSGFHEALIRKKDPTDEDYSTVFLFNVVVSCFLLVTLFKCASD